MTAEKRLMVALALLAFALPQGAVARADAGSDDPTRLVPTLSGWHAGEAPRAFGPENLFEYINGAAEAYLSYDFRALAVGDYVADASKAAVTAEIYDMGTPLNAFGIYGAERFSESRFIDVGSQGYAEDGVLNFLHGRYYVKLLCFDCEGDGSGTLAGFARAFIALTPGEPKGFPPLLRTLPRRGLVANSEKYILRNVLGFAFLHDGYLAAYRDGDASYDGFLVEAASAEEAEAMRTRYLNFQTRNGWTKTDIEGGIRLQGRSGDEQYLGSQGRFFFGLIRGRGISREAGSAFLGDLRGAAAAL